MELETMVRNLETTELKKLLAYFGRPTGAKRKTLLKRALNLAKFQHFKTSKLLRKIYMHKSQHINNMSALRPMFDRNKGILQNIQPFYPTTTPVPFAHTMRPHNCMNPFSTNYIPPNLYLQHPLSSNVKFKEFPFYVKLYELLPPTNLITIPGEQLCERNFSFCLTPYQVLDLQNIANTKVHMRIGLLNTKCEQDDIIPPNTCIKINGTDIRLPCVVSNRFRVKRAIPKHPLDITFAIKKTDSVINSVYISWFSTQPFVVAVNIVRRQGTSTFLNYLKSNAIRSPNFTKTMITEKFQSKCDPDIATMSLKGSLICPVGKVRMELPCRAMTCEHLQCFDAKLYFEMNENNPKWICPICNEPASFENLIIDGLFLNIISEAPNDCIEVEFCEDGTWTLLKPVVEETPHNCITVDECIDITVDECIDITVDECIDITLDECIDITLDESFEVSVLETKKQIEVINLE